MPTPLILRAEVRDGHLSERARRQIANVLPLYEGKDVEVTIRPPKRSTRANALLWAGIYPPIQRALADSGRGVSCEALHVHYAAKYLPPDFSVEIDGETVVGRGKTSKLDSTTFSDFIEAIKTDDMVLALGVVFEDEGPLKLGASVTIQNEW